MSTAKYQTYGPQLNSHAATNTSVVTRRVVLFAYAAIGGIAMTDILPYWMLVVPLAVLVVTDLLLALDEAPAVRELAAFISTLQYIIGPCLLYAFFNQHARYRMHIPAEDYFSFALPATCAFMLAMQLPLPFGTSRLRMPKANSDAFTFGMLLVLGGLASTVLMRYTPGSLAFVLYLFANMRYVGAIYVYMSEHRLRWPVIVAVVVGAYITSTQHGMFHELLLWASLGGSYWFIGKNRSMSLKVGCVFAAILVVAAIQVVKPTYRKRLNRDSSTSFVATAGELTSGGGAFSEQNLEAVVIRISQGWLVSAAMKTVPARIAHAGGKTIEDAALAATLPRFLNPNKKVASSRDNLNAYTFLRVEKGTQMGLGPLGESWVNFGYFGGMVVMFGFGLLLNSMFRVIGHWSWKNEYFFYCMPLAFLQVVKAETEFLTIFNHITKSFFIILFIFYAVKQIGLLPRGTGESDAQIQ